MVEKGFLLLSTSVEATSGTSKQAVKQSYESVCTGFSARAEPHSFCKRQFILTGFYVTVRGKAGTKDKLTTTIGNLPESSDIQTCGLIRMRSRGLCVLGNQCALLITAQLLNISHFRKRNLGLDAFVP